MASSGALASPGLAGALALLGLVIGGCGVGTGKGLVQGTVTAPACGLSAAPFNLAPNFFAARAFEGQLEIRIQNGSDLEARSNGLSVIVANAAAVQCLLRPTAACASVRPAAGVSAGPATDCTGGMNPVPTASVTLGDGTTSGARMNLYLNKTCPIGRETLPVNYAAASGQLVFCSIYAPAVSEDSVEIAASFSGVTLQDPADPTARHAELSGWFSLLHVRGRPAQRYP